MSWEVFFKIIGLGLTFGGLVLSLLSFYFSRADKLEQEKVRSAHTVKELERQLAQAVIDQIQLRLKALEEAFGKMSLEYSSLFESNKDLIRGYSRITVQLTQIMKDFSAFSDETKQNFGKVLKR